MISRVFFSSAYQLSGSSRTVVPSSAGSSSFHSHVIPSCLKRAIIVSAIFSKFAVARANIVGPAPDKQIPQSPACDFGVTDFSISVSPGIKPALYG